MKTAARCLPRQGFFFAALLISLCALSTGLQAQNIYKCGNSYSQTPCPGASTLNLNDARDVTQKRQSDAATRRDTGLAAALEKDRVTQEKIATTQAPATVPGVTKAALNSHDGVVHKITPKRIGPKHHKPKAFIAEVPGSEKKPTGKKSGKRKTTTPA
jgi:hypothetical protein